MHNPELDQPQLLAELETLKMKVAELQIQKIETEAGLVKCQELLYQYTKLEAVGWIAGGILYDFNNLLTVILINSEMVFNALPHYDPLRADVAQIERTAATASEMASQFFSFSRHCKVEPQILDLNLVIMKVEKLLRQLRLSVTVTGGGIDPTNLPMIFNPFFTTKAPGAGNGLGLATADRLVKESGGEIEVYSQVGLGMIFQIYFLQSSLQEVAPSGLQRESRVDSAVPQFLDELVFQPASTLNLLV
jgi:C4-dicarboxylate-specific signal transduction histidine kinase